MNIVEAALPEEVRAAIPGLRQDVVDYLELEDAGFNPRDVKCGSYFLVDDSVGLVVFDYAADEHDSPFAFVQYSLASGLEDSAFIGCWTRTEGESLRGSIAEYLERNPIQES